MPSRENIDTVAGLNEDYQQVMHELLKLFFVH